MKKMVMFLTHGMGDMYPPLSIIDDLLDIHQINKNDLSIYVDTAYFAYEYYPQCLRDTIKVMVESITKKWQPTDSNIFSSGDWYGIPDRKNGPLYENIKNDFFFYRQQPLKEFAKQFIRDDIVLICGTGMWSYEWKNGENIPLSFNKRKKLNIPITHNQLLEANKILSTNKKTILIHCRKKGNAINDEYFNFIIEFCKLKSITPILIGLKNEVIINNPIGVIDLRQHTDIEIVMYLIEQCPYMITSGSMFTFHRFFSNKPTIIGLFESNVDRYHCFQKEDIDNPNNIIYDADQPHLDQIKFYLDKWSNE